MRARALVLVAVVACSAVAGAYAMWPRATRPQRGPFAMESWPAGTVAGYAFRWTSNASMTMAEPAEGQLASNLDLAGELELRSYGMRDGGLLVGVRVPVLTTTRVEVLGGSLGAPGELASALAAAEAAALLDADGRLRELQFTASSTPLARSTLRALVIEFTAHVHAASGNAELVDTALGRARIERLFGVIRRATYVELDAFPDGMREPPALTSTTRVTFDSMRIPIQIESIEDLDARAERGLVESMQARTSLSVSLLRRDHQAATVAPPLVPGHVREPAVAQEGIDDPAVRRASLERRARGVTRDSVLADIRAAGTAPQSRFTDWIWRDAAFLELHPAEAQPILDAAMATPHLGVRAAAFDIVVIAGTEHGQAALVRALSDPALSTAERLILVEHLAHLARPTRATIDAVEAMYARAEPRGERGPLAFALGGLARHAETHEPDITARICERFESALARATTDDERVLLLGALGNAGQSRSAPVVTALARSTNADVRRSVASALRRMEGDTVVDSLLALSSDPSGSVAARAIASLSRKQLAERDWTALAEAVASGALPEDAHAELLGLASERRDDDPLAPRVLLAMLASDQVSPELKSRIEAMLAR